MDRLTFLVLVEHDPRAIVTYHGMVNQTYYHSGCLAKHITIGAVLKHLSGPTPFDTVPLDRMCPKCSVHHHGRPDTPRAG